MNPNRDFPLPPVPDMNQLKTKDNQADPRNIITFYSFKGGVGRTMSLVNTAFLLAKRGYKILVIDWDLEAPSIDSYFESYLDQKIDKKEGLIDFLTDFKNQKITQLSTEQHEEAEQITADYINENIDKYIIDVPSIGQLSVLKAGLLDDNYNAKINNFQWMDFFRNVPYFFRIFAAQLKKKYDYVLIDSRTGLTDIGGICAMLMPDKLVLAFTPNKRSLDGIINIARQAREYRRQSSDRRPLLLFPLPSRIEDSDIDAKRNWQFNYQKIFESLFKESYRLNQCDLTDYFNSVQIKHVAKYAYGEQIAVATEASSDISSLAFRYEQFFNYLMGDGVIWKEEDIDTEIRQSVKHANFDNVIQNNLEPIKLKVFYSYSHADIDIKNRLDTHLAVLKRSNKIATWSDQQIISGVEWDSEIIKQLQQADIILLLISADFVASDYIWQKEMPIAIKRHNEGQATVIPIFIRDTLTDGLQFSKIQGLPVKRDKLLPISQWENKDEAFTTIARGIQKVIEDEYNKT